MQLTDLLARSGGIQSIARQLGLDEAQATSAADALLPSILGGMRNQAPQAMARSDGLGGLGDLLGQLGGGSLFDDVVAPQPVDPGRGNDILGQIFGSKDVSRAVASNASTQSGLDASVLRKMLPMLAMLVTGYLAKQRGGDATQASAAGAGNSGGGLGGLFGPGGLASMLDADGNGNPLDDILRALRR